MYRIWTQEKLNLRKRPARAKLRRVYQQLLPPARVNEGWAMDFLSDWVVGHGQEKVRIIQVMDECSRKALWTEAHKSIKAKKLTQILEQLVQARGCPAYIRCDNGPELISKELANWAKEKQIELRFIQPRKPTQNGLIERLNGTLRTECLKLEWFESIDALNHKIQEWWMTYNTIRPHQALGFKAPDTFEILNVNTYFSQVT